MAELRRLGIYLLLDDTEFVAVADEHRGLFALNPGGLETLSTLRQLTMFLLWANCAPSRQTYEPSFPMQAMVIRFAATIHTEKGGGMQSEWYVIVLTREQRENGEHERIRDTFKHTVQVNENMPTDVALYVDTDRNADGSLAFYFSPGSFTYFKDLLEKYGYERCERPDGHAVEFVKFL